MTAFGRAGVTAGETVGMMTRRAGSSRLWTPVATGVAVGVATGVAVGVVAGVAVGRLPPEWRWGCRRGAVGRLLLYGLTGALG